MATDIDPSEVARAAAVVMTAYGADDPLDALRQAKKIEDQAINRQFATAVREEVERLCSLRRR